MAVKEIKDIGTSVLTKLKKQAKETGINYQTCLQLFAQEEFLRHAASEIMSHQKLPSEVEIDTPYKSINLKGTRPQNMPRYSKKKGKQSAHRQTIPSQGSYYLCYR